MTDIKAHQDVESGFADAITYNTHRPSYPAESVNRMLEKMKILEVPAARILEIGVGTGKLTEQLVAHERSYKLIAVELHVQMRKVLHAKALPGGKVLNGMAGNLEGIEEAWADGVVVAQISLDSRITNWNSSIAE